MRRASRRGQWAAIVSAILLYCVRVWCDSAPIQDKVVLITVAAPESSDAWPEAEDAICQELMLMNLAVETVVIPADRAAEGRAALQRIAGEKNAAAAVRLIRSEPSDQASVELWIVDRVTGKTTYRELAVRRDGNSGAVIDTAVRTVEALRASLLELRMADRSSVDGSALPPPKIAKIVEDTRVNGEKLENESSTPKKSSARSSTRLLGVWIGGSADWSSGGLPVRGAFALGLFAQPIEGLDIELNVSLSPLGPDIRGDADLSTSSFGYTAIRAALVYRFFHDAVFQPAVGAVGGIWIGWVEGRDAEGSPIRQDAESATYLGGTVRGCLFLKKSVAFVIGVTAGSLLPEIQLNHGAGIVVGHFGRPLIEGYLALQVRFL